MYRLLFAVLGLAMLARPQQPDITGPITQLAQKPVIAVPDFRGSGDSQTTMKAFNAALGDELENSGAMKVAPKTFYPLATPQRPEDFHRAEWYSPPVGANYVAFGYAGEKDGGLVLFGWLYNTNPEAGNGNLFGKLYFGTLDDAGAKKVAREFAADILRQFGVKSLAGTKIYFVSDRSRSKEIWRMDYDGSSQERVTSLKSITQMPAVSPDGTLLACSSLTKRRDGTSSYQILMSLTGTSQRLPFENPAAPTNGWPEFTRDGQHLLLASSLTGYTQIYMADLDGGARRQITNAKAIDVSPKVNPKNGTDVLFISDRSGSQQLWRMNIDGGDIEMLTNGVGEVANPSWSPDGRMIAFAWTQGFELGGFNVFVMDIATRKPIQLTKDSGVNENPWWAPDGLHIVYTSKRGNTTQIYTMLADGTSVRRLTDQGNNYQPVWSNPLP